MERTQSGVRTPKVLGPSRRFASLTSCPGLIVGSAEVVLASLKQHASKAQEYSSVVGPTPQDMGSAGVCIGVLVLVRGRQCHPSLHPNPRVGPAGYWTQAEPQTRAWQHPNPDSVDVLNFPWQPVDNDSRSEERRVGKEC